MPDTIAVTLERLTREEATASQIRDRIAQIAALLPRIKDLDALERVLAAAKEGARNE